MTWCGRTTIQGSVCVINFMVLCAHAVALLLLEREN